jgi:hypothetical protein
MALAKLEVERLQSKGMIVLHYGLYSDTGEVLLPEVVFTYKNADSPKAEEIISKEPASSKKFRQPVPVVNMCAQLFN